MVCEMKNEKHNDIPQNLKIIEIQDFQSMSHKTNT